MRDGSPTPCPGRSRRLTSQVSLGPTTPVFSQTMNGGFFAANTTGYLASPAPLGHQAPEPPSAGTLPSGGCSPWWGPRRAGPLLSLALGESLGQPLHPTQGPSESEHVSLSSGTSGGDTHPPPRPGMRRPGSL